MYDFPGEHEEELENGALNLRREVVVREGPSKGAGSSLACAAIPRIAKWLIRTFVVRQQVIMLFFFFCWWAEPEIRMNIRWVPCRVTLTTDERVQFWPAIARFAAYEAL